MIEILRLKNGEDIIGEVRKDNGNFEIHEPMAVHVENHGNHLGLSMHHWLPVQIIDKNYTTIKENDILATFMPNDEFCEYYINSVDKIKRLLEAKEAVKSMSEKEIEEALQAAAMMESPNFDKKTLH